MTKNFWIQPLLAPSQASKQCFLSVKWKWNYFAKLQLSVTITNFFFLSVRWPWIQTNDEYMNFECSNFPVKYCMLYKRSFTTSFMHALFYCRYQHLFVQNKEKKCSAVFCWICSSFSVSPISPLPISFPPPKEKKKRREPINKESRPLLRCFRVSKHFTTLRCRQSFSKIRTQIENNGEFSFFFLLHIDLFQSWA